MAEENQTNEAAAEQQKGPQFNIQRVYTKDIFFRNA